MARDHSINKADYTTANPINLPIKGASGAVTRGSNKTGAREATPAVRAIRGKGNPRPGGGR